MLDRVRQNLIYTLETMDNVNASLLIYYLEPSRQIRIDSLKSDEVFPELLVDFPLEISPPLVNFYKKLRNESSKLNIKRGMDFRFVYVKWKLGHLPQEEKEKILADARKELSLDILLEKVDIALLYKFRIIVTELSLEEKRRLWTVTVPMAVYFARSYRLLEFSLCVLLALDIGVDINSLFFTESLKFFYWNQRENGLFDFSNPFIRTIDFSQSLLTTAYCILAIDRLKECGYEKDISKQI